jgi:hypothetical protein
MQKKADLKERLTEHLMIIIQENETRKAEKLQMLMTKMALSEEDAVKAAEEQTKIDVHAEAMARAQHKILLEEQGRQQATAAAAAAAEAEAEAEASAAAAGVAAETEAAAAAAATPAPAETPTNPDPTDNAEPPPAAIRTDESDVDPTSA